MERSDKRILPLMLGGLVVGTLADLLLRTVPWGINILLWITAFMAIVVYLARRYGIVIPARISRLALPACFFAASFAWRDSDTLKVINGVALCSLFSLVALRRRDGTLAIGRVIEYSLGLLREWLAAPIAYLRASRLTISSLNKVTGMGIGATPVAVMRGILISIPPLLLFGALLCNADASFERLLVSLLDFDLSAVFSFLLWLPLCTVIAGGILLRIMLEPERCDLTPVRGGVSLGTVETSILLGTLNLLFFGFIFSQLGYFFGGSALLANTEGLKVAIYARRGFFELVTVSMLVLPLLLTVHWLLNAGSAKLTYLFRTLSGSLVMMLFAIMASAMHRMYLYQHSFGLTELRLYTSTFMVWLALVFVWFLRTVLFEKRDRFAFGALVSCLAIIALLDIANPDAIIVSRNTARLTDNRIDARYLTTLSSDAVPALIDALPALEPAHRGTVVSVLQWRSKSLQTNDWRSWNLSRQTAQDQIRSRLSAYGQ
ncbi:MAG: hypothetical protein A2075_08150 [Geobacteraceae bacterium GWC2_58_44]|nr:MAG: hypothetical protein A2075_08150 [Geobacteraceae bacterium GWC2_58_44]HBG07147.1 hypothetical protein [Geobacter sp.]